ncbi:hypothetical protein D9M69_355650 [compost metagenome]
MNARRLWVLATQPAIQDAADGVDFPGVQVCTTQCGSPSTERVALNAGCNAGDQRLSVQA